MNERLKKYVDALKSEIQNAEPTVEKSTEENKQKAGKTDMSKYGNGGSRYLGRIKLTKVRDEGSGVVYDCETVDGTMTNTDAPLDAKTVMENTTDTSMQEIATKIVPQAEFTGVEDKSLRTANARHYISGNGERKAVITWRPRHYYSEADKRMRRIDNTLALENGAYENKYNDFKVRFAPDLTNDSLMRLQKDGYEISFALAENNGIKARSLRRMCNAVLRNVTARISDDDDKLESGIDYPDIFDGVNFEYEVKPNEIKENIRIVKRSDNYEFAFVVTANGLRLEANTENNTIELYPENADSESAEPIFAMPAPYMFDDGGETSYAVKYSTERIGNGKYLIKILPDETWINAVERKFPVTIDPTVTVKSSSDLIYKFVSKNDYIDSGFYKLQSNPI